MSDLDYEKFRLRVLTERVKTGSSALKISRKLGVTKGVVIGILWRAKHSGQLASVAKQLRPPAPKTLRSRSARPKQQKPVAVAHPKPKPPPAPRPPPPPPVSAAPAAAHWQVTASAVMRPPEAVCVLDAPRAVIEAPTAAPAISAPARLTDAPKALPEPSRAVSEHARPAPRPFVPILIAPNHANADERRAEAQRSKAHSDRLAAAAPLSEAEEQRLIDEHIRQRGVTACPTMAADGLQNEFGIGGPAFGRRFRTGTG